MFPLFSPEGQDFLSRVAQKVATYPPVLQRELFKMIFLLLLREVANYNRAYQLAVTDALQQQRLKARRK